MMAIQVHNDDNDDDNDVVVCFIKTCMNDKLNELHTTATKCTYITSA